MQFLLDIGWTGWHTVRVRFPTHSKIHSACTFSLLLFLVLTNNTKTRLQELAHYKTDTIVQPGPHERSNQVLTRGATRSSREVQPGPHKRCNQVLTRGATRSSQEVRPGPHKSKCVLVLHILNLLAICVTASMRKSVSY